MYRWVSMITTSLGAQYLQAAFAKWRENNLWANEIPWEGIPLQYRDEIELAARLMMMVSTSTEEGADFVPEATSYGLAA
jgi:hypothetical protein